LCIDITQTHPHSWTVGAGLGDDEKRVLAPSGRAPACPGPRGNPQASAPDVERGMRQLLRVLTH
jgi:hypothetical protein